ncbi:MAG: ATP-binding cassette domain-containing protein [Ethanoligenens sp.]|uniref:ABC transporter ATP-binding protein n=1 Tax=Ethanoligenens sp. TaxID=2099655 RepID=UPI0039EA194E
MSQIVLQDVVYRSGEKEILTGIDLSIEQGDFLSVVGPSGCGKSTLLKLCCHLISPSAGRITLDGRDMMTQEPTALRRKVAYCLQTPVLFGKTVEENLVYPYQIRRQEPDLMRARAMLALFQLGKDCMAQDIQSLSGGEKQRIALARTLLFTPDALLLDEATSALDAENTHIVEQAVEALNREGVTVLWVTHSEEQSRRIARRRLTMGNGRIRSLEALQ